MKKNKILFWTATIIVLLWEGIMPLGTVLFAPEYVTFGTKALGYPDYFAYALIICKVLGVVAITFPQFPSKLKEWAYAGLTFNLVFALISHAAVDGNIGYMLFPVIVLALLAISYFNKDKIKSNG